MYIWPISQLQQRVSWNQEVINTLNEGIGKVVLPQADGTVLCMEKTLNFLSLREWIRGFYDLLRDILTTMCVAHCVGFPYKLVLVPGLCGQCGMTKVWHVLLLLLPTSLVCTVWCAHQFCFQWSNSVPSIQLPTLTETAMYTWYFQAHVNSHI